MTASPEARVATRRPGAGSTSGPVTTGPRGRAAHGDGGQILVLTIGYTLIALLLVTVVVSATAVHLERKRLLALADQTALAAATALDEAEYYGRPGTGTDGGLVRITAGSAREAAADHLAASPAAGRLDGLVLTEVTTDGRTAQVTLSAVARPALISVITAPWSDGIPLRVTAGARAG